MSVLQDAVDFLRAFAQAQARLKLYGPGHPARNRAMKRAYDHLVDALAQKPELVFTFLEGEVVLDDERIREMQGWEPGRDLAEADIERMEFSRGIPRKEFGKIARSVGRRLADPDVQAPDESFEHARFGQVAAGGGDSGSDAFREVGLEEEADAVSWLQERFETNGEVETAVARAVVLSVGSAVRQSENALDLLVPLREQDEYSTAHSMNVSVLAIGLAESLGYTGDDVRSLGEAAVLHDLGKQRVPSEILQKPAGLTEDEWEIIRRHPEDGARLLLESDEQLELAALVAYEHHREWSGGGYPTVRYPRRPHPASQLIQICDVYDALRTQRPFRDPWPRDRIMDHIQEGSGERFDPQIVRAFASMIERLEAEQADRERGDQEDGEGTGEAIGPPAPAPDPGGGAGEARDGSRPPDPTGGRAGDAAEPEGREAGDEPEGPEAGAERPGEARSGGGDPTIRPPGDERSGGGERPRRPPGRPPRAPAGDPGTGDDGRTSDGD